jgi:hypothetical protein
MALPVGGNNVPTPAERGAATKLPRCELRVDERGDSIVLEGVIVARAPVSGSYELRVLQKGPGGSSDVVQGGEFNIEAGALGSLGIVSLSMNTKNYSARLSVQWDDGAPNCKSGAPRSAKQKLIKHDNDISGPMKLRLAAGAAPATQSDLDLNARKSE